jgi:hypothetical protein
MAGKGGSVNVTLEQRIDNILGPWPTPDQTREAFLLLARHLQRHDELVTLQRDIDAYAECRRMPDDALDALEAHRDRLRQEIWDGTPIPHLAKEAEAELASAKYNGMASLKDLLESCRRLDRELSCSKARIRILETLLAERDADAEVGRAIRELRPKEGHLYAEARIRPVGETPCCCRVSWRTPGRDGVRNTRFYDSLADAIKEYNERED